MDLFLAPFHAHTLCFVSLFVFHFLIHPHFVFLLMLMIPSSATVMLLAWERL